MAGRFVVRKQTSGRNGDVKFYVFSKTRNSRITVHGHLRRESAQHEADSLNIADLILDYELDPRPYEVRLAEAEAAYYGTVS